MINVYMNNSVTLMTETGQNSWNVSTYSSVAISARIENKTVLVKNLAGEDVKSQIQLYLSPDLVIGHKDKMIVAGVEYAIIKIDEKKDFSETHIMVYL